MNFEEFLNTPDKKFYKISEIEKIARKDAEGHKSERSKLSKLSHLIGSQQTALDIFRDMKSEIDLCQDDADPLERVSSYVHALMVTNKCEYLVSVNTKEFKKHYNKFKQDYFQETSKFVEQQYKEELGEVLINHLRDALAVLIEKGDLQAEKRLQDLDNYEELINIYRDLTQKLDRLIIDFNLEDLQECTKLLHLLQNHKLANQACREVILSLQKLYQKIIHKAKVDVELECDAMVPSINEIIKNIGNYLQIRDMFNDVEIELGYDEYSPLLAELSLLLKELEEKFTDVKEQFETISDKSTSSLKLIISCLSINQQIIKIIEDYNFSYLEVNEIKDKLTNIQLDLTENYETVKSQYLEDIKHKLLLQRDLALADQLKIWQLTEKKMIADLSSLEQKNLNLPELEEQLNQLSRMRLRYVRIKIQSFDPKNKVLQEFEDFLTLLLSLLPESEIKELGITNYFEEIVYFKRNLPLLSEKLEKLLKLMNENKSPMPHTQDINFIVSVATQKNLNFYLAFTDFNKAYGSINLLYLNLQEWLNTYIAENCRTGNLILHLPKSQAKIAILEEGQLTLGRAGQKGNMLLQNNLQLPWSRISGQHLLLDFKQGLIQDLNSSNGTFINKKTDKISTKLLSDITEFNLASDLTFKVFYEPTSFSGILFSGFSTKFDHTLPFTSKTELGDGLTNCFFIYLHPENKNTKLYIRKFDGKPIYGNDMLDEKDCYIIKRSNGWLTYTDLEEEIVGLPIMKKENPQMKLEIVSLAL